MGNQSSQVTPIVIPSRDPFKDANDLAELCADLTVNFSRVTDADRTLVLSSKDEKNSLFLYSSNEKSKTFWPVTEDIETLLASWTTAASIQPQRVIVQNQTLAAIHLSGGSIIFLIPQKFFSSTKYHSALTSLLIDDDNAGVPSMWNVPNDNNRKPSVPDDDDTRSCRPLFPTLRAEILNDGSEIIASFPLNCPDPVAIENDFFVGRVLFLVQPADIDADPYWRDRVFAHKKRRMILQIQGEFKRKPSGVMYIGAEITQSMHVGLFTRGVLALLVRLLDAVFRDFAYSFGTDNELPRVAAPVHSACHEFVETPDGQEPPPFNGLSFNESTVHQEKRMKARSWDWNTGITYSFSFHSMYVDLPSWRIANLRLSKDIDLKRLWADAALRVVLYEHIGSEKAHTRETNEYALCVQIQHRGTDSGKYPSGERDVYGRQTYKDSSSARHDFYDSDSSSSEEAAEARREDAFFDAQQHVTPSVTSVLHQLGSNALLREMDKVVPALIEIPNKAQSDILSCFVVVSDDGRAFYRSMQFCVSAIKKAGAWRTIISVAEKAFSPRLVHSEKLRRIIGVALLNGVDFDEKRSVDHGARCCLNRQVNPDDRAQNDVIVRGTVVSAVNDRHWVQQTIALSNESLSFYREDSSRAVLTIQAHTLRGATLMQQSGQPLIPGVRVMRIDTLGRSHYLMFPTAGLASHWVELLQRVLTDRQIEHHDNLSLDVMIEAIDTENEFLRKSSLWKCKKRRLLNHTHLEFRVSSGATSPAAIVEKALTMSMQPDCMDNPLSRYQLFEWVAQLKFCDITQLSENERLAFFINLYHLMICHAMMLLGPPGSALKWISYFTGVSYQVNDDIFSVAELEHNIIRARMSKPSQLVSRFVVPKTHYAMAMSVDDFRLNFALNCGSLSNPSAVFVYNVDKLNKQLDDASLLYLANVSVSKTMGGDAVLYLPRVCNWFSTDFGKSKLEIICTLAPLLHEDVQEALEQFRLGAAYGEQFDVDKISIRYCDYSFRCRPLSLK